MDTNSLSANESWAVTFGEERDIRVRYFPLLVTFLLLEVCEVELCNIGVVLKSFFPNVPNVYEVIENVVAVRIALSQIHEAVCPNHCTLTKPHKPSQKSFAPCHHDIPSSRDP